MVSVFISIPIIVLLLIGLTRLGSINSDGQGEAFLLLLSLIVLAPIVFFIALGSCGGFQVLKYYKAVDDLGLQALGSSARKSFIDWPWLLPWLLALAAVVWAD